MKISGTSRRKLRESSRAWFLKYCSFPLGYALYCLSLLTWWAGLRTHALETLLRGIRFNYSPQAITTLKKFMARNPEALKTESESREFTTEAKRRAIVLSCPYYSHGELIKGVMLLSFTDTIECFLHHPARETLDRLFAFVLEPSWAGYADANILGFIRWSTHCIVQASEIRDRILLNNLFPETPCLDTGASNWVDDAAFAPAEQVTVKDIDAIYIANGNPVKRVFAAIDFFIAAGKKSDKFRALIVCPSWGGGLEEFREYASRKGASDVVQIIGGMKQHKLVDYLHRSKVSILLSLKEGSNRVLFESMFSGVPVICQGRNIGVNKAYINSFTGLLVNDDQVVDALLHMSANWEYFAPREWAMRNISAEVTTLMLSNLIRARYASAVNSDMAIKVNCPEVRYKETSRDSRQMIADVLDWVATEEAEQVVYEINRKYG